jgi:hypothetical protein
VQPTLAAIDETAAQREAWLDFVIQNQPHRTGTDLRRELVGRLACHGSTFSGVGASDQPGAVQARKSTISGTIGQFRPLLTDMCRRLIAILARY